MWIEGRSSLHPIHSTTDGLEGFVDLDAPAGQLALPANRLSSGNPLEERELRRRIDIKRYPTIDGVLTGMERLDDVGRYRMRGNLQFHGVTRACEGVMQVEAVDERTLRLAGESTFDVRHFGVDPPRLLLLKVEPEVVVRVELFAERA